MSILEETRADTHSTYSMGLIQVFGFHKEKAAELLARLRERAVRFVTGAATSSSC